MQRLAAQSVHFYRFSEKNYVSFSMTTRDYFDTSS